jgi:Mg2+-importing ATPase
MPAADALARLGSDEAGLSGEAHRRLALYGANALRSRGVSALSVLVRQLHSYLLGLLLFAAVVSAVVGDGTEALIIGDIMAMSHGVSFLNEYRSEKGRRCALLSATGRPLTRPCDRPPRATHHAHRPRWNLRRRGAARPSD